MYLFKWLYGSMVQPDQLRDFADLYSNHYGVWGKEGAKPGQHVRLTPDRLQEWLVPTSRVVWATFMGQLVGYAVAITTSVPNRGSIAWVTQLVVHEDHRRKDVGKRLLFSIWRFTDHFAWGVLSANPYAIRALEKATRRRCQPRKIRVNVMALQKVGRKHIPYVKDAKGIVTSDTESRIDTKFFLDHSDIPQMLADVVDDQNPWQLGPLPEGWEWFAFTFRDQEQLSLSQHEIAEMLAVSDQVTHQAYGRMIPNAEKHAWARHHYQETLFIVEHCKLDQDARVADFGCGNGRHTIALAEAGMSVLGLDYVESVFADSREKARSYNLKNAEFRSADCRNVQLGEKFAAIVCLYDVIGSYANDFDNQQIADNISQHLIPGGYALVSVMNMERTVRDAKYSFSLSQEADKLLSLMPSDNMERSGEVFNPDFYMIHSDSKIVYRKEQFQSGEQVPEELLVRDRRYFESQIRSICMSAGLDVIWSRYVKAGDWSSDLPSSCKEILLLCRKPFNPNLQRNLFAEES